MEVGEKVVSSRPINKIAQNISVAVILLIATLVVGAVVNGLVNGKDSQPTVYVNGSLYGNFVAVQDKPDGMRGTPVPYDTLWGPMSREAEAVLDNGRLLGNCVTEGERNLSPAPHLPSPYPSVFCSFIR